MIQTLNLIKKYLDFIKCTDEKVDLYTQVVPSIFKSFTITDWVFILKFKINLKFSSSVIFSHMSSSQKPHVVNGYALECADRIWCLAQLCKKKVKTITFSYENRVITIKETLIEEITKRYISGRRKFNAEGGRKLQEGMISKRINQHRGKSKQVR